MLIWKAALSLSNPPIVMVSGSMSTSGQKTPKTIFPRFTWTQLESAGRGIGNTSALNTFQFTEGILLTHEASTSIAHFQPASIWIHRFLASRLNLSCVMWFDVQRFQTSLAAECEVSQEGGRRDVWHSDVTQVWQIPRRICGETAADCKQAAQRRMWHSWMIQNNQVKWFQMFIYPFLDIAIWVNLNRWNNEMSNASVYSVMNLICSDSSSRVVKTTSGFRLLDKNE